MFLASSFIILKGVAMRRRLIRADDAQLVINSWLSNKNRLEDITVLTLDEVNMYIDTLKVMQGHLENTTKEGLAMLSEFIKKKSDIKINYNGHSFELRSCQWSSQITASSNQLLAQFSALMLELDQQKRYLEKGEKKWNELSLQAILKQLAKRPTTPLSDVSLDKDVCEVIGEAEDNLILDALLSRQQLVEQNNDLKRRILELEQREAKDLILLKTMLTQSIGEQKKETPNQEQMQNKASTGGRSFFNG